MGHGIDASATMGRLRMAVRTLADIDLPPDELLTHLDDIVTQASHPQDAAADAIPGDVGATCLHAVYDPVPGYCALARAGHPAPILVHPDDSTHIVDLPPGPPLGLGSLPFEAAGVRIPEGSLPALVTDGLYESRDRDVDDGIRALRQALARPARPHSKPSATPSWARCTRDRAPMTSPCSWSAPGAWARTVWPPGTCPPIPRSWPKHVGASERR